MSLINFLSEDGEDFFRLSCRKTFEGKKSVLSGAGKTSSRQMLHELTATFRH